VPVTALFFEVCRQRANLVLGSLDLLFRRRRMQDTGGTLDTQALVFLLTFLVPLASLSNNPLQPTFPAPESAVALLLYAATMCSKSRAPEFQHDVPR
jgi:hypothetical protein